VRGVNSLRPAEAAYGVGLLPGERAPDGDILFHHALMRGGPRPATNRTTERLETVLQAPQAQLGLLRALLRCRELVGPREGEAWGMARVRGRCLLRTALVVPHRPTFLDQSLAASPCQPVRHARGPAQHHGW